jgi:NAD(P)-dependent dehydrogenase (short-subunit alcohol dehydrogenase family)
MLLTHRVAVISGPLSSSWIAHLTARLFAEQGAVVVFLDPDESAARAAALELGAMHLGFACDLSRPQSCQTAAKRTLAACGRVDVLVHNTGLTHCLRHVSDAFIPYMQERGQGSIACMSEPEQGVVGLARGLARQLGPDNIRVNCVAPGRRGAFYAQARVEEDPSDIAGAFLFLASDLSAYLTGAVIDVDGGRLIH